MKDRAPQAPGPFFSTEIIMTMTEQLHALGSILAQGSLHSLFQPIISLSERRILGYEALSRGPSNSPLHSPLALFCVARQAGRLNELEIACRQSACKRFSEQALPGKLFLNVSPESLLETTHQPGRTLQMLREYGIAPSQIVIELTEQAPTDDFQLLQTALHHYRDMGFSIALDDLGAGYSSLRLWSELRPDYVKIDRHFIDGIHQDALKREFVGSILQIAKASRAQVIAEGIELPEELAVLTEMGVDLIQGYLLCRPQEHPPIEARLMLAKPDSTSVSLNEDPVTSAPCSTSNRPWPRTPPQQKSWKRFAARPISTPWRSWMGAASPSASCIGTRCPTSCSSHLPPTCLRASRSAA